MNLIDVKLNEQLLRKIIKEEISNLLDYRLKNDTKFNLFKVDRQDNLSNLESKIMKNITKQQKALKDKSLINYNLIERNEALQLLDISNATFSRLVKEGHIKPVQDGYKHYFDLFEIQNFKKELRFYIRAKNKTQNNSNE